MRKKAKISKQGLSFPIKNLIGILVSATIGLIFTLLLTFILSVILTKSSVLPESLGFYFIFCVFFCALITGFVSSKICNFKGIVSGIMSSIPYSFFITIISILFADGQLSTKTSILYIGIFLLSILGGIISANMKKRK